MTGVHPQLERTVAAAQRHYVSSHDQDPSFKIYRSVPIRRLIVSTFVSLGAIMQAPGGPEEDPTGGFTLGGRMFNYRDEARDFSASGLDGKDRELLPGLRTCEIFEAYSPYQP